MQQKPNFTGGYAPLNAYVAPLRPELWRVIVGIVLMLIVYIVGIIGYFAFIYLGFAYDAIVMVEASSPAAVVVFLSSFVFMGLAAMLACLWPAQRSVLGLFGPIPAMLRDFRVTLIALVPVIALAFFTIWAFDPSFVPNQSLADVWLWLLIGLVFLMIQVTAEELVFRGYIMGQLAARFASSIAWMIIPSALFGLVHYDAATYGTAGAWIICAAITYFAILISDITARTGNLGAAIALHFANNVLAIFLISHGDALSGLSLFTYDFDPTQITTLVAQFLFVTAMWLAARLALKV